MTNNSTRTTPSHCEAQMDRREALKVAAKTASGLLVTSTLCSAEAPTEAPPGAAGYPDRTSYRPGDEVRLHVSTTAPRYSLEVARVGARRDVVLTKTNLKGASYAVPANASTHGCDWPVATSFAIPADWRSGYYAVRIRAEHSKDSTAEGDAFFVLRAAHPGRDTKILLQLSTNTYNAYNDFGGSSFYAGGPLPMQGARVSFDRPFSAGFLSRPARKLSRWHPYAGWHRWERPFVAWAEAAGYRLDYAANSDLEFHPEILKSYRLVLSVGHDEYWSAPMRNHLESFIADGGNVAFFSGNTCYWQVRSEDEGKALVCYKTRPERDPHFANGPHALLASLWSHRLVKRPENQLTGVSFCYGGYHRFRSAPNGAGAYTVYRPEHWIFKGTDLQWGDQLGARDGVVGYECDGCDFQFRDGLPYPTHSDGTPETFEILGMCPASLWDGDREFHSQALHGAESSRQRQRGAAVLGTYTRGGTVFTTGCTEWSRGLEGGDDAVMAITRNVLDRLST